MSDGDNLNTESIQWLVALCAANIDERGFAAKQVVDRLRALWQADIAAAIATRESSSLPPVGYVSLDSLARHNRAWEAEARVREWEAEVARLRGDRHGELT